VDFPDNFQISLLGFLNNRSRISCQTFGYFRRAFSKDIFPLPLFQEMSRYENHIEIGLGTKNGLFQGVSRLLISLQNIEIA
jgi:hypothetical protein